jgi:hypothetical protein
MQAYRVDPRINSVFYRAMVLSLLLMMAGCAGSQPTAYKSTSQKPLDADGVVVRLKELRSWPDVSEDWFERSDWQSYVDLARVLQRTDPGVIEDGLSMFYDEAVLSVDWLAELSRPYILLRVMFEIPDRMPDAIRCIRDEQMIGPLLPPVFPENSPFGETDATPVAWTRDGPVLTAQLPVAFMGTGLPYVPADEYRFFATYFRFRELPAHLPAGR